MAVVTAIVGSTLRSTCTRMTCSFEAPSSSAASTYWARAYSRVAARVTRKKNGASRMPTGTMAWTRPLPSAAVTATAKKMYGRVISASVDPVDGEVEPPAEEHGGDAERRAEHQADPDRLERGEHRQPGARPSAG